jgi:uncharacterized phiE125 gp8 family phage protein
MTASTLIAPPTVEPVTLTEAKAHARIDSNEDDALVTSLITAARQWAERYTNRAFITQTWKLALDTPPKADAPHEILLPKAPLQSVTKVEAFSDTDTPTLWPEANYFVDTSHEPGRLVQRLGATWPAFDRLANGMEVTYVAGYGDDASSVPEPIRAAIRELITDWYQHRGDEDQYTYRQSAFIAHALLAPYRQMNLRK